MNNESQCNELQAELQKANDRIESLEKELMTAQHIIGCNTIQINGLEQRVGCDSVTKDVLACKYSNTQIELNQVKASLEAHKKFLGSEVDYPKEYKTLKDMKDAITRLQREKEELKNIENERNKFFNALQEIDAICDKSVYVKDMVGKIITDVLENIDTPPPVTSNDKETLIRISQILCGKDEFPGDIVKYIANEIKSHNMIIEKLNAILTVLN